MIRRVILATLLVAFFSGCCIPGGACIGKTIFDVRREEAAKVKAAEEHDMKHNWQVKLVEAEGYCAPENMRENCDTGKDLNNRNTFESCPSVATKMYRHWLTEVEWDEGQAPPEIRYSLFDCRMSKGDYPGALAVAKHMVEVYPELVKPYFLVLKAYMYPQDYEGFKPHNAVRQQLSKLKSAFPGQEPELVGEIQELIGKEVVRLTELKRLQDEDDARWTDLSDYETLEQLSAYVSPSAANAAIEYWLKKGYTSVVWVPLRDDFGMYYSEIWGKSAE